MADPTLEWRGPQVIASVEESGAQGAEEAAQRLLQASNQRVPVDSGELRDSGRVTVEGLEASVGYGAPHAVAVHENLEAHHDQGQAKFLEAALLEEQRALLEAIAASIKLALAK